MYGPQLSIVNWKESGEAACPDRLVIAQTGEIISYSTDTICRPSEQRNTVIMSNSSGKVAVKGAINISLLDFISRR
jgi:hypothetical protein